MQSEPFDQLTKLVGKASSRRSALRGFMGRAGAGLLAAVGATQSGVLTGEAKKKNKSKKKNKKKKRRQCNTAGDCQTPNNPCQIADCRQHTCRKENQPDGTVCGDGLACEQGVCVCPPGNCVLTVRPSNLLNWEIVQDSEFEFVIGPATPPLGAGSVRISTIAAELSALANQDFDGLPIDQIETLGYSTYMTDGSTTGVVVPAIKLLVLYDDGTKPTTLVFEPTNSENSDVEPDEWQTWDALSANARWWSTRAIPDGNPTICADTCFVPWDDVLAAIPDAAIAGALRIETGSGTDDADGNVDAIAINNVVYNFEPDA